MITLAYRLTSDSLSDWIALVAIAVLEVAEQPQVEQDRRPNLAALIDVPTA